MNLKETVLIGATVIGLAVGANHMLSPSTPEEVRHNQQQRMVEDLADADGNSKQRMRDEGNDQLKAENDQKLHPGERRLAEPYRPRIRIRLP